MPRRPVVLLLHGVQSSASTWWRVGPDLRDLGCTVLAWDLPGHGDRPADPGPLSLESMAADVAVRIGRLEPRVGGIDLLVGHSMGALVGLTLAAARPDLVAALLLEDPPALGPSLDPTDVAASVEHEHARALRDPTVMTAEVLARNPLWAHTDAANDIANLRSIDVAAVTAWLRHERWDLVALVRDCPVPTDLLLATESASATTRPAREQVVATLGPDRVVEVASSHSVHRDRPGVWVATALRALERDRGTTPTRTP